MRYDPPNSDTMRVSRLCGACGSYAVLLLPWGWAVNAGSDRGAPLNPMHEDKRRSPAPLIAR